MGQPCRGSIQHGKSACSYWMVIDWATPLLTLAETLEPARTSAAVASLSLMISAPGASVILAPPPLKETVKDFPLMVSIVAFVMRLPSGRGLWPVDRLDLDGGKMLTMLARRVLSGCRLAVIAT